MCTQTSFFDMCTLETPEDQLLVPWSGGAILLRMAILWNYMFHT